MWLCLFKVWRKFLYLLTLWRNQFLKLWIMIISWNLSYLIIFPKYQNLFLIWASFNNCIPASLHYCNVRKMFNLPLQFGSVRFNSLLAKIITKCKKRLHDYLVVQSFVIETIRNMHSSGKKGSPPRQKCLICFITTIITERNQTLTNALHLHG